MYKEAIDDIKVDLKEIGWEGWIGLNWSNLVRAVMNFRVP